MPEFHKILDSQWAASSQPGPHGPVGYLTSLTLGSLELEADQRVRWPDPAQPERAVVAVLTMVQWSMGTTDPLALAGLLSMANLTRCVALGFLAEQSLPAAFSLAVWEADSSESLAFCSLSGAESLPLRGTLEGKRGRPSLNFDPQSVTPTERNARAMFQVCISPVADPQVLRVAASSTLQIERPWWRALA